MNSPTKEEIRAAREAAGLSQTEAAALVYTTLSGWQRWEYGQRAMHPAFWELFQLKVNAASHRPPAPHPLASGREERA